MMSWLRRGITIFSLFFFSLVLSQSETQPGPQMVRLAMTTESTSMVVQWTSYDSCEDDSDAYVIYGPSGSTMSMNAQGSCYNFTLGNADGLHYIHLVTLNNLQERTVYNYQVKSGGILLSDIFYFKTLTSDPSFLPNIIYFGDLGHNGGEAAHRLFTALPAMIKEIHDPQPGQLPVDFIIHAGDFAYDLQTNGGINGDNFQRYVQNISAYVPYMTCVGNHEQADNFSNYRNRFHMPRSEINEGYDMWYSFDMGPMHIILFSTETLFSRPEDNQRQYDWLEDDLIKANENRKERPWIITVGHRPMYCSNKDNDCITPESSGEAVRAYVEDLFFKYGVDIEMWAHEHTYERTWPVFNYTIPQQDYINPMAPVHLISGAAGCNEDNGLCVNPIYRPKGPWSAYATKGYFHPYSYGHLRPMDAQGMNMYWDQINAQTKETFDQITISQSSHGQFAPLPQQ